MCRCVTAASLGLCCSGEQCRSGKGWASDCACEHSHGFIGSVSCRHLCHRTSAADMHSLIFCCCDILGSFAGDPGISHDQGWVRVRRRRGPSCCLFIGWMVCAGPGCLGRISRKMLLPLGTEPRPWTQHQGLYAAWSAWDDKMQLCSPWALGGDSRHPSWRLGLACGHQQES